MKGLEQLIHLRGGFEGLSFSLVQLILTLATPVLRSHYNQAMLTVFPGTPDQGTHGTDLVFTLPSPINSFEGLSHECNILLNTSIPADHRRVGEGFLTQDKHDYFDQALITIIHDVRMLTICVENLYRNPSSLTAYGLKFIGLRAADVQNQLSTSKLQYAGPEPAVEDACRLALLIFVSDSLELPGLAATSPLLGIQMKESLEQMEHGIFCPPVQDALLWALFFGAAVSSDDMETYSWFVRQLQQCVKVLTLQAWDEVEELMKIFFYREDRHRKEFQRIWRVLQQIAPAAGTCPVRIDRSAFNEGDNGLT